MSMDWTKKRKKVPDDEEAKLNDALLEFQAEFGQTSSSTQPKTFLRGEVVEGNKTVSSGGGNVYAPKFSLNIASKTSNVGSTDFDEAKKLAAAKARRMIEDAARNKNVNVVPKVVVPTTRPTQRPPKPGSLKAKNEKPKVSNLEMFKMELQRVQEDREKRKDFRNQLEKVGVNSNVVERIVPFVGTGDFDDDPYTTNLYVANIPHYVTEEDLFFTFGSFGPLAALKILYARNEEERRRPHICAFVAYMSRVDVDRFMNEVRLLIVRNEPIRVAFARPVQIPVKPYYIPPQLLKLQCPDPISALPFNAQPIKEEAENFLKKYKTFPPLNMLPTPEHPAYEDFMNLIRNSTVRVVIPPDRATLRLINRTATFVITEGPLFEAMICTKELENPMFQFLWDNTSACHVYYRWRIFSLLQGDSVKCWRREKFRMFKNGSWWIPPLTSKELNNSMPKCLYDTTCVKIYPERWLKVEGGGERKGGESKTSKPKRTIDEDRRRCAEEICNKEEKRKKERRGRLSEKKRDKLEKIIRELTPEQNVIGEAMLWCVENAGNAKEISECVYESLTYDETPLHKKIARLYLINDILSNCVQRNVRDVFMYRCHFEMLLEKIFVALGNTYKSIVSRIKQEQFKQRVMNCFRHWEETALYPVDKLIHNQNIFLGLVEIESGEKKKVVVEEEDDDLDGIPIVESQSSTSQRENVFENDDDIDGVPLGEEVFEKEEKKPLPIKFAQNFKPIGNVEKRKSPLVSSKWDDINKKSDEEDDIDGVDISGCISPRDERGGGNLSPGEIKDADESKLSSSNSNYNFLDEKRRKMIREIEVRAVTMLDDLEADGDVNAKKKVDQFRKTEMENVERKMKEVEAKEEKKRREKDHKGKKEKKNDRSRSRSRERGKDRERKERDRRSHRDRSSDRDRDKERRHR